MKFLFALAVLIAAGAAFPACATPDFTGFWEITNHASSLKTAEGNVPPLLPEAEKTYRQNIAARRNAQVDFDSTNVCKAPGLPRQLYMGSSFLWLQSPSQVYVMYQWNREARLIDVGIDHAAQNMYAPLYYGFSTGRWRGDDFVVDSVDFNDATILDAAGLPHSDVLHVIERYRLIDGGNKLQVRVTIDDPKIFTRSWDVISEFRKLPAGTVMAEDVCVENRKLNGRPSRNLD